jgi:hypothetical protein
MFTFYHTVFLELLKFMPCIFSEVIISKYPSRAMMCKSGHMDTVAIDGNCHIMDQKAAWYFTASQKTAI